MAFLRRWWIIGLALGAALLLSPAVAWSGSGRGGDDDDDHETFDNSGADDGSESDGGESDGGESDGGESDGGESDGGEMDGGESDGDESEGGESDGGESGSGDDGSGSDNSGSGSDGDDRSDNAGHSSRDDSRSGRGHGEPRHDVDDRIDVVRNDDGERVRAGEAVLLSKHDVRQRLSDGGFTVIETFRLDAIDSTAVRVAMPAGMSPRQMLDALRKVDPKGIATFNHVYDPAGTAPVKAASVAVTGIPAKGAKVGLVDAGVDAKHPLLKRVTVTARTFDATASMAEHGTAVASRIAEAAPGAAVFAANVFSVAGDGQAIATADAIARGLDWLAKMRVPVINLSLTGPANPILEAMTARLSAQGHILVAAVGNEGPRGAPQYPAAYEHVIGVTAVDAKNRVYLYANQGSYVDFAARGVDARVADANGAVDTVSGTSYAAPIIAAKLARSVDTPNVAQAQAALNALAAEARDLGAPGRDPVYGLGLIVNQ